MAIPIGIRNGDSFFMKCPDGKWSKWKPMQIKRNERQSGNQLKKSVGLFLCFYWERFESPAHWVNCRVCD